MCDGSVLPITAPNGEQVPAKIVQQPDGDFKVEYSSKYTGKWQSVIQYLKKQSRHCDQKFGLGSNDVFMTTTDNDILKLLNMSYYYYYRTHERFLC